MIEEVIHFLVHLNCFERYASYTIRVLNLYTSIRSWPKKEFCKFFLKFTMAFIPLFSSLKPTQYSSLLLSGHDATFLMLLLVSLPRSIISHYNTCRCSHVCPLLVLDVVDDQPFMMISLTMFFVLFSWGLSSKSTKHIGIIHAVKVVAGTIVAEVELVHEPSTMVHVVIILIQEMHHPDSQSWEVWPLAPAIELAIGKEPFVVSFLTLVKKKRSSLPSPSPPPNLLHNS